MPTGGETWTEGEAFVVLRGMKCSTEGEANETARELHGRTSETMSHY